ncbi:MAG TPA: hypothetical protein VE987_11045 [Polyangiaceae bacterium]|nr:hypothetical protein [Polyangiaceae bacterium]
MAGAVLLAGTLAALPSSAAPTAAQLERARRLFLQAEADEDGGRWEAALDKLRQVADVKLTAGVRYHLALCEEHLGRLARAMEDYRAAERQGREDRAQDVLRLVGKQLAELEPRVPRVTVRLVPDVADAWVRLDGEAISRESTGDALMVDPGPHRVEAATKDRPTAAATFTAHEHDTTAIEIKLAEPRATAAADASPSTVAPPAATPPSAGRNDAPSATPLAGPVAAPAVTPTAPAPASAERAVAPGGARFFAIGMTTLALGLAAGGAAAYVEAGAEHDRAVSACAALVSAPADACDVLKNRVRAWDFAAAGSWIAATAAAAVSIALWVKPTARTAPAAGASLWVGPAAAAIAGRF